MFWLCTWKYVEPSAEDVTVCRGHHLPVTCVVITPDMQYIFSGSKDCTIIKCRSFLLFLSITVTAVDSAFETVCGILQMVCK